MFLSPKFIESAAVKREYPDDRFELCMTSGSNSEQVWRVGCLDCPGRLFIPGAGMRNFALHLKNKGHRQRVVDRMKR
ncbi:hypothetical protein BGY98DRAFT_1051068 [Russula aff. rugulosa BPL654]|nr:hypothetical protein BGY98DRAFT_1051068 [Russula aff. rugulosa BPL654]